MFKQNIKNLNKNQISEKLVSGYQLKFHIILNALHVAQWNCQVLHRILASHCDLQGSYFASRLQNCHIFAILKYIILLQNFRCYRSYWIWLLNKNRWDKKNPFPKSYLGWQSSHGADLKKNIGHRFFLPFNRLRQKYH